MVPTPKHTAEAAHSSGAGLIASKGLGAAQPSVTGHSRNGHCGEHLPADGSGKEVLADPGTVHTSAETLGTYLPGDTPPGRKQGLPGDGASAACTDPICALVLPVVLQGLHLLLPSTSCPCPAGSCCLGTA